MKISFITIFPEIFETFKNHSIIKKAIRQELIEIETINIRDFVLSKNNSVDDYIYGGGHGMLMLLEPIVLAIESVKTSDSYIIFLGPKGIRLNQEKSKEIANFKKHKHLIIISGHYEGIDSRIKYFIDEEISIGDFILTGGEYASIILVDSIIRLLPGVLKIGVTEDETFENNCIEYDQFSKPIDFRGYKVPEVLLNGNHKKIKLWRKKNSLDNTINYLTNIKGENKHGN